MLEIAIIICIAAAFIILAIRFRRTKGPILATDNPTSEVAKVEDDKTIAEAKNILQSRRKKTSADIFSSEEVNDESEIDELNRYSKELLPILKNARDKINGGKFASAEGLLIDAIVKDKRCTWAYEQLGLIYLKMGRNLSDAKESFEMALKLDQESAPAWFGLGKINFSEGKFHAAINDFSRAVNLSRIDAEYYASLGMAYLEIRQFGKAAKALKRAYSLDISNQDYKKMASWAEDKHREHSQATKLG